MTQRHMLKQEVRLVWITASHCSKLMRCSVPSRVMPALLTSTSTGPSSASIAFTAASQASKSQTSNLKTGMPVSSVNCRGRLVVAGIDRPRPCSRRPSAPREMARPMPRVPPVTTATRAMSFLPVGFASSVEACQSRSTHMAMPMPPPMHSVARPFLASRLCISCSRVTRTRAPEAPIGWPSAIAPPLTLTFVGIPAEVLVDRAGLGGEGLVGLDQVEVVGLPAGLLERLAAGRDRAGAHDRRIDAGGRPGDDAGQRREAALAPPPPPSSAPGRRRRH